MCQTLVNLITLQQIKATKLPNTSVSLVYIVFHLDLTKTLILRFRKIIIDNKSYLKLSMDMSFVYDMHTGVTKGRKRTSGALRMEFQVVLKPSTCCSKSS